MPFFPLLLAAGLLAASIPIIIHLLHRQKTTPLLWGAMIFLKQSPLQMKRRKQVDHWLLMLLRIAVLAFLAWVLAQPEIHLPQLTRTPTKQPIDVAIVIDHSLSMGRRNGAKTLLEDAQDFVGRLTRVPGRMPKGGTSGLEFGYPLRDGDTLSVVLAEHRPRKLTPAPVPVDRVNVNAIAALQARVDGLQPGNTDCTIPEAIAAAREVLKQGPNAHKIVLVVSDEQRSNWALDTPAAWDLAVRTESLSDHKIEVHSCPLKADMKMSNITVGNISMQPSVAGRNRPAEFTATVKNSGPESVSKVNIDFSVNDAAGKPQKVGSQMIEKLDASQSVTVRFDYTFKNPGSNWVKVSTDLTDALAADNESVFAVNVWQTLPVLVIRNQPASNADRDADKNLDSAMRPVDVNSGELVDQALIQPSFLTPAECDGIRLEDYYAVVLNDLPEVPASLTEKLGDYVSSGRGLWVVLGNRSKGMIPSLSTQHNSVALFTAELKDGIPHELPPAIAAAGTNTIEVKDPTNPAVTAFNSVDRAPLATAGTRTMKWWGLSAQDSNSQTVLASTNGDPLVLERQLGSGRVVVWTTSVDGMWNTWQKSPDFEPLIHETLYHLTDAQTRGNRENITAGQSFAWSGKAIESDPDISVEITPPQGAHEKRQAPARDARYEVDFHNAFLPGIYRLDLPPEYLDKREKQYQQNHPNERLSHADYLKKFPPEALTPVYYGVGINPRELDNTTVSDADMDGLVKAGFVHDVEPRIGTTGLAISNITPPPENLSLWKWLTAFVVISLCLETFMTYRMARLQKNVDTANAGLVRA